MRTLALQIEMVSATALALVLVLGLVLGPLALKVWERLGVRADVRVGVNCWDWWVRVGVKRGVGMYVRVGVGIMGLC